MKRLGPQPEKVQLTVTDTVWTIPGQMPKTNACKWCSRILRLTLPESSVYACFSETTPDKNCLIIYKCLITFSISICSPLKFGQTILQPKKLRMWSFKSDQKPKASSAWRPSLREPLRSFRRCFLRPVFENSKKPRREWSSLGLNGAEGKCEIRGDVLNCSSFLSPPIFHLYLFFVVFFNVLHRILVVENGFLMWVFMAR